MPLPRELSDAIEARAREIAPRVLKDAATALSESYRGDASINRPRFDSAAQRIAYCVTRLPATFAAARETLGRVFDAVPEFAPRELLDLGAGCGATSWAAMETFPSLQNLLLIERDRGMIALGREFAAQSGSEALRRANWIGGDFSDVKKLAELPAHDLVVMSYSLSECDKNQRRSTLESAWQVARQALILIEPGTPEGFGVVRDSREQIIEAGARLLAPCPHSRTCPMQAPQWCHFSVRLERSKRHRAAKDADLGWEDEKFSYAVFTKSPVSIDSSPSRIIGEPRRSKSGIAVSLCTDQGLQNIVIPKRDREKFALARRLDWGDAFRNDT